MFVTKTITQFLLLCLRNYQILKDISAEIDNLKVENPVYFLCLKFVPQGTLLGQMGG